MTSEIIPRDILRQWRRQSMGPTSARTSRGTEIPTPTPIPKPVQSLLASEWGSVALVEITVGDAGVLVVDTSVLLPLAVAADLISVVLDDRVEDVLGDDVLGDDVLRDVVLEDDKFDGDEPEVLDDEDDGVEEVDEGLVVDCADDVLEEDGVEVVVGEEEDKGLVVSKDVAGESRREWKLIVSKAGIVCIDELHGSAHHPIGCANPPRRFAICWNSWSMILKVVYSIVRSWIIVLPDSAIVALLGSTE